MKRQLPAGLIALTAALLTGLLILALAAVSSAG